MTDRDMWNEAARLVQQHGQDAEIEASIQADRMLDEGDLDGKR